MLNLKKSLSFEKLTKTCWAFGISGHEPLTKNFHFATNGQIDGFASANEARWQLQDGRLEIFSLDGTLTWQLNEVYIENGCLYLALKSLIWPDADFTLYELTKDGYAGFSGSIGLSTSEYLFPTDLQITPTSIRKILFVELYYRLFQEEYPQVEFDYILFNNAGDLPNAPPSSATEYDFQYLQIPLRTVVSDRVITDGRLNEKDFFGEIFTNGCDMIDVMLDAGLTYNKAHGLLVFVSSFIVPQMEAVSNVLGRHGATDIATLVQRLNEHLAEAVQRYNNVFLCNVDAVAASIGKRYILDDVTGFYTHGSFPHQDHRDLQPLARIEPVPHISLFYETKVHEFLAAVYDQALATFRTVQQIDQVKAVIFDLDNTLWNGQIAEDYRPDRTPWPTGAWQNGIWEAIQHVRARGIMIAICSKNDLEVVQKNWGNAVQPPFLKLDDFLSVKINWKSKSENIAEICREFNITPKSVVFVDDNPVEREEVRSAFPEIRTIGSNPYLTRRILLWAPEMQVARITNESAERESSIRGQFVRDKSRAMLSREEFLKSIDCQVTFLSIIDIEQPEFARILELTNKTNQFNTTGKRWTQAEVVAFLSQGGRIFAFRVKDRFSDYGLVGVVYASESHIAQIVMSCRVLGMEVEQAALAYIVECMRHENFFTFATLTETPDNSPCREIFSRAGFEELERKGQDRLFRLGEGQVITSPSHIKVSYPAPVAQ